MASLSLPVNIKKMLDAQTTSINSEIATKASETQTTVNSTITTKAAETQNLVVVDNDVTQSLVTTKANEMQSAVSSIQPLIKLAPNLNFPRSINSTVYQSISGFNASAGLTTLINLTGKFIISYMNISGLTAEQITIKLTVDGVVIWDDTFNTTGTVSRLVGQGGYIANDYFICENSLTLELQTATDSSINFYYLVRPIL